MKPDICYPNCSAGDAATQMKCLLQKIVRAAVRLTPAQAAMVRSMDSEEKLSASALATFLQFADDGNLSGKIAHCMAMLAVSEEVQLKLVREKLSMLCPICGGKPTGQCPIPTQVMGLASETVETLHEIGQDVHALLESGQHIGRVQALAAAFASMPSMEATQCGMVAGVRLLLMVVPNKCWQFIPAIAGAERGERERE